MTSVLFLCVHNAGRSQMAAAITNTVARKLGVPVTARSAGTMPADRVHPNVVQVVEEWDIDLSNVRPRTLTDDDAAKANRIITMGCEVDAEDCPAVFLKGVEDWELPDPKLMSLDETRSVRNEIADRVIGMIQLMLDDSAPHPADSCEVCVR